MPESDGVGFGTVADVGVGLLPPKLIVIPQFLLDFIKLIYEIYII